MEEWRKESIEHLDNKTKALFEAVYDNNLIKVEELIADGVDVSARDERLQTPLHWAAEKGHICIVKELLAKDVDVNTSSKYHGTALHSALSSDNPNLEVMETLIRAGADVNLPEPTGYRPLHYAICVQDTNAVNILIKAGADTNVKQKHGKTPLHLAVTKDNLEIINILIKGGADIESHDKNGDTPLKTAIGDRKPKIEIVAALIKAGANVNAKDKYDSTPLHTAAWYNYSTVVIPILIKTGADINAQTQSGETPLHTIVRSKNPTIDTIKALIQYGSNVNAKDNDGKTPLHLAASSKNLTIEMIGTLIGSGSDINSRAKYDQTPLHTAADVGNHQAIDILIKAGADINSLNKFKRTPLFEAVDSFKPELEVIKYLIKLGANVNTEDRHNTTILDKAISIDRKDIISVLLSHAASIDWGKEEQRNYFLNSTLFVLEQGNPYQKIKAWLNIFNTFSEVSDDPQYTQLSQKIIKNLAVAWDSIDLDELKITFAGKKIGDISKVIADLYNVIEFCDDNKDKYRESNPELYESLQKIIPGLEESVDVFKSHKTDLILEHIGSEITLSEFKGRIKFCISQCNSFKDTNFLKDFLTDYLDQDHEFINEIPIYQHLMHLNGTLEDHA
ncbi:hypothetical protein phytr_8450 [Candidatus Phycorickettsia trachydisci]|uniref:Uncharacterized protein n=1 Tax=Candidatus Phycorickettsia trachydisci TaxID=2115978 RepID=A0A2P1P942_9RICK|nr:ankyrin repeat domain-containing protein [Candidatus Phycorickettsia trachydisci]AVP87777.1 hypothetical protein phytr_8450 [Candidatus Phycorickettsia trachydisci]